jgi:hypothetical protein
MPMPPNIQRKLDRTGDSIEQKVLFEKISVNIVCIQYDDVRFPGFGHFGSLNEKSSYNMGKLLWQV